jgi:uncharacterized membrane protein
VLALLALPLALRRVPPNLVYGFRTRTTLGDERIWYEANACFGRWLLIATIAGALAALALDYWRPFAPEVFLPVSVGVLALPALVATIATFGRIRSLRRPP